MAQKKEDEIMAEYLLKGGRMLEKTCRQCGCPMFEYKKKTFCVVCAEREQQGKEMDVPHMINKPRPPSTSAATGEVQGTPDALPVVDTIVLADQLVATVHDLCARIRTEEDPDRCLTLMDAVKIGVEALQILNQL